MDGVVMPAASAAVAVTILKVEPGGWMSPKAIPAAASIAPVRGFITVMPPYLPPSASIASCSSAGSIVVRTVAPRPGVAAASTRVPASSLAAEPARPAGAGRPARARRPRPWRSAGSPPARTSWPARPGSGRASPAIAAGHLRDRRGQRVPSASGCPLSASSVPRRPITRPPREQLAGAADQGTAARC